MQEPAFNKQPTYKSLKFSLCFYTDLIVSLLIGLVISVMLLITPGILNKTGIYIIPLAWMFTSLIFYYFRSIFDLKISIVLCAVNTLFTYGIAKIFNHYLSEMNVSDYAYVLAGILIFAFYALNKQLLDFIIEKYTAYPKKKPRLRLF